jgi:Tol biopolymer transport system component
VKLDQTYTETVESENKTSDRPANFLLSRTGIAMGTAAYMSPEQVRSEKLDARSDLFSFGLVLYEMATGSRAITGETGPELQHAVLSQTPAPPRQLNPELPVQLERIILKSLEKGREVRYQSASDLRTELQKLKATMQPRRAFWWATGAGIVALVLAISSFWFVGRQSVLPMPELKLRQLTANSSENNVSGGLISPDGKYLAFSDLKGFHVKAIESGETRAIPRPKELEGRNFEWKCAAWSPDSSRFLVNSFPSGRAAGEIADKDVTIWVVPIASGIPQKLRSSAFAWSFSPDGSRIAFGTDNGRYGPREIWLMDAKGENARKLFESGDEDTINTASWSKDGQQMNYAWARGAEIALFSRDLEGGPPVLLERPPEIADKRIDYGITLPDGHSIFSVTEEGTIGSTEICNFWVVKNDLLTGKVIGQPRRLTNWAGFCMDLTSATTDGKKVAFVQLAGHPTIYVADLEANGTRITNERHLTLTESMDVVADWTPESRSIIFFSKRNGQAGIYEQRVDEDVPKLLMTTPQYLNTCCVTPDGLWFIYTLAAKSGQPPVIRDLMRIPIAGGTSQRLFSVRNVYWLGCARSPSHLCAIAERSEGGKEAIITSFDPEKGRGAELTRIALDPNVTNWTLGLSSDGKRFAVIRGPGMPLQILSLKGYVLQEIKIPEWSNSGPIAWAGDGKALFVPVIARGGAKLVHVNLRGQVDLIRENPTGNYTSGVPSPDGRHLAIEGTADSRNIWTMENF